MRIEAYVLVQTLCVFVCMCVFVPSISAGIVECV